MEPEQQVITCPKCNAQFPLGDVITHKIEEQIRTKYLSKLEADRQTIKNDYQQKLNLELNKIKAEQQEFTQQARTEAEKKVAVKLANVERQLKEATIQADDAQKRELDLLQRVREAEDKQKNAELYIAREVQSRISKVKSEVETQASEEWKFKLADKDKTIADLLKKSEQMQKQVEDMQKKIEQGSQQNQGEVAELILEDMLKEEFQFDVISPVGTGTNGADVVQEVKTNSGRSCGKIIWESKRTKLWNEGWLSKIRGDQQAEKADIAVLVSEALPKGKRFFFQAKDIWITDFATALCLAAALRKELITVSTLRQAMVGQNEKKDYLYQYVTGPEFRNRIGIMLEAFTTLQTQLEKERKAMQTMWANREKQLRKVIDNTSGMYGDLQGIVGKSLPNIVPLELPHEDSVTEQAEVTEENEIPF